MGSISRQEVAFLEKNRKSKGCGILKRNFHTKFMSIFRGFGAVTWFEFIIMIVELLQ